MREKLDQLGRLVYRRLSAALLRIPLESEVSWREVSVIRTSHIHAQLKLVGHSPSHHVTDADQKKSTGASDEHRLSSVGNDKQITL